MCVCFNKQESFPSLMLNRDAFFRTVHGVFQETKICIVYGLAIARRMRMAPPDAWPVEGGDRSLLPHPTLGAPRPS